MVALGGRAGVGVDGVLAGTALDTGGLGFGVAHARGGQLGQHRLQGGAQLGGDQPPQLRHAVGLLAAQAQAAPPRPILIGVAAVGVEAIGEGGGQLGELFGAKLAGLAGQLGFGALPGGLVDPAG